MNVSGGSLGREGKVNNLNELEPISSLTKGCLRGKGEECNSFSKVLDIGIALNCLWLNYFWRV